MGHIAGYRFISLPMLLLLAAAMFFFSLSSASERGRGKSLLNIVVFESYMTPSVKEGSLFDEVDLPDSDFPRNFSQVVGLSEPQNIKVPFGLQLPVNPIFIDIYTFVPDEIHINRKKSFSRRNDIAELSYKAAFAMRSNDRYEVELEGNHESFKFSKIVVEALSGKTAMIRIRRSANRTLYFALTLLRRMNGFEDGIEAPKAISRPTPHYPSDLRLFGWTGNIRILCTISPLGTVDLQDYILMECPHVLFARSSMDIIKEWKFIPATHSGVPIAYRMQIDVPFSNFSPKPRTPLPKVVPLGPRNPATLPY